MEWTGILWASAVVAVTGGIYMAVTMIYQDKSDEKTQPQNDKDKTDKENRKPE